MLDTIERPITDKITEPSKQWVNRFKANRPSFSHCLQRRTEAGEIYEDPRLFPSKEVAEQAKLDLWCVVVAKRNGNTNLPGEYLGAFPVTP